MANKPALNWWLMMVKGGHLMIVRNDCLEDDGRRGRSSRLSAVAMVTVIVNWDGRWMRKGSYVVKDG